MGENFEDARSDAHSDASSEISEKADESQVSGDENEIGDKNVSQMLKEVLTTQANALTKESELAIPVGKDKQSLMTSFVSGSLQPGQPTSRSSSPAGRRKLADRSPDIDKDSSRQKDKKPKRQSKK